MAQYSLGVLVHTSEPELLVTTTTKGMTNILWCTVASCSICRLAALNALLTYDIFYWLWVYQDIVSCAETI